MSYHEKRVWRITPQTTDQTCQSVIYLDRDVSPLISPSSQLVVMLYCRLVPGTLRMRTGEVPEFVEDAAHNWMASMDAT